MAWCRYRVRVRPQAARLRREVAQLPLHALGHRGQQARARVVPQHRKRVHLSACAALGAGRRRPPALRCAGLLRRRTPQVDGLECREQQDRGNLHSKRSHALT